MSSENIHITRHNYEEYFLLYVDNELSAAERMAVETFLTSHPDLREELDILLQTSVLQAPSDSLGDKTFLMAESMKFNAMDDSLLLYVDNELGKEEKSKVEKRLKTDADFQLQYDLLRRTKLEDEKIVYPYKAELYRRTERVIGAYWLRIAAAVIVIAAIALVYFLNGDGTSTPQVVADVQPNTEKTIQPQQDQVAVLPADEKVSPSETRTERSAKSNKEVSVPVRQQILQEETREQIAYSPVETQTDPVSIVNTTPEVRTNTPVIEAGNNAQQTINTGTVTDPNTTAYNTNNDVVTTAKDYAFTDSEKGSSVKGLLRKATRFIEKRTGLNPVNEDDELLIGVVSIKLK